LTLQSPHHWLSQVLNCGKLYNAIVGCLSKQGIENSKKCTLIFTPIPKTRFLIHGLRKWWRAKYRVREEQSKVMISFPQMEIQGYIDVWWHFSAWHEGHHTVSSLKVHYHCFCEHWISCIFEYDICC
jgi:hypothetical protein